MDRPAQPERYEPLPPLLEIPGHLIRKMSPLGRRIALGIVVLFLVALAITVPRLLSAKDRDIAAEQAASARANAARIAALKAESQPVDGTGPSTQGLSGDDALRARRALAANLNAAIVADAARRHQEGKTPLVAREVQCVRFPERPDSTDPVTSGEPSAPYSCLAVTASINADQATSGATVGYPYRALVHFDTGRFTYCKVSGRPGEMAIAEKVDVPVPKVCGGT